MGSYSAEIAAFVKVRSLYGPSPLLLQPRRTRFDTATSIRIGIAWLKSIFLPIKNLAVGRRQPGIALRLLLGPEQLVFCGSYGTIPSVLGALAKLSNVDPTVLDKYPFYCNDVAPSLETYRRYLREDGVYLANLYDQQKVGVSFLKSAIHLLGREYIVERLKTSGLDYFVHGYATGTNVNVYTTPFYRQHLFIDFGSAVGTRSYPRLADLVFFKKNYIAVDVDPDFETALALARTGDLEQIFEREWDLKFHAVRP